MLFLASLTLAGCAISRVETSKTLYQQARQAQAAGDDMRAVALWKEVLHRADREIQAGNYLNNSYFLRATARMELGQWEAAFQDLKNVQPGALSADEMWIYPLYSILMGDSYSQNQMLSVAASFYESVLKKSTWKSSPLYLLALERQVNNAIRMIETQAEKETDPAKYRGKEYAALTADLQKYVDEHPAGAVSHYLLADLLEKTGETERSLEHLLAAYEMGLPTADLRRGAEYQIATLLGKAEISKPLKSTLLRKAAGWWAGGANGSMFRAGEGTVESIGAVALPASLTAASAAGLKIRYLAVVGPDGQWTVLAWEEVL